MTKMLERFSELSPNLYIKQHMSAQQNIQQNVRHKNVQQNVRHKNVDFQCKSIELTP